MKALCQTSNLCNFPNEKEKNIISYERDGVIIKKAGKKIPIFIHSLSTHTYLISPLFFFLFLFSNQTEQKKKKKIKFSLKKMGKLRLCDCERLLFFTTQIVVFFLSVFQILGFLLRLLREVPANGSKQGNFNLVI